MHPSSTQSLALAFGIGSLISLLCVRIGIPAILPLLLAGIALGRSGLSLVDSADLGQGLGAFITVSIGVLIFEGGLHLDKNMLKKAPHAVWGLLTRGALVSLIATAVLAHFVVGMTWSVSLLLGATLMVTGPTVVQPILRRIRLTPNLHSALGAEAVLIDPIGVIAAVSTLDLCLAYAHGSFAEPFGVMILRYVRPFIGGIIVGASIGILCRMCMRFLTHNRKVNSTQLNLLAMAACTLSVGFGEWMAPEAGLVAATVCAILMAHATISGAREMHLFKEQISIVLVGALFILLASGLDVQRLLKIDSNELFFIAGIVLLVRPLSVAVGTFRSALTIRERLFASFMAPRGIVAASVASISAVALLQLAADAPADSEKAASTAIFARDGLLLEQLVFQVIFVTVALAGILAWPLAWILGVHQGPPNGVLIIGSHALGRQFAQALKDGGVEVRLVDSNSNRVAAALAEKLPAIQGDATDLRWLEEQVLTRDIGWVIAWTDNADVDKVVCRWGAQRFKPGRSLLWARTGQPMEDPDVTVFGGGESLAKVIQQIERKERNVKSWTADQPSDSALMAVSNHKLSLLTAESRAKKTPPDTLFIGIN